VFKYLHEVVVTTVRVSVQLLRNLTSSSYAESIRRQIDDSRTRNWLFYEPTFVDYGTIQVNVLTPSGSAVAMTSTINYWQASSQVLSLNFTRLSGL